MKNEVGNAFSCCVFKQDFTKIKELKSSNVTKERALMGLLLRKDFFCTGRSTLKSSWVRAGFGNLLHLRSQTSPFATIRNPPRAAKLPSGSKISVSPKVISKKRSSQLFVSVVL